MLEMVPAFLAINFEIAASRRLAVIQRELQGTPGGPAAAQWTSPPNLRILLRNLGRIDPSLAPAVLDPLREIAAALPPTRVQLGPIAAFPSPDLARLLIVEIADPSGVLQELSGKIEALVGALGINPVRAPFHPHVLLARFSEPVPIEAWLGTQQPVSFEARLTEVAAYLHAQKRAGAEHVALDRFGLAPPPRPSQRPSRAPRQPSQRPSKRPKPEQSAQRVDAIPAPPRLPSIPMPQTEDVLPVPQAAPSGAQIANESGAGPKQPILPALEAALPPEDDWGS